MKTTKTCPICQVEFTRVHTQYKPPNYCSRACANKAPGRMTEEIRKKIAMIGPKHPNFKGGWKARGGNGGKEYYFVWIPHEDRPKYPTVNKRGYIHRSHYVWNNAHPDDLVLEGQLVHHKNENTLDDSLDNLEKKISQTEHMLEHRDNMSKFAKNRQRDKYTKRFT